MSRRRKNSSQGVELNLTPLIDMIFILLIFFMVTASFVRESGIDVERPVAQTSKSLAPSVVLSVDHDNVIWLEGNTIDIRSVRAWMTNFANEAPEGVVVIAADVMSRSGVVVSVLDACKEAGIENVSVATKSK